MYNPTLPTDEDRLEALETMVDVLLEAESLWSLRTARDRIVEARMRGYKTPDGINWTKIRDEAGLP